MMSQPELPEGFTFHSTYRGYTLAHSFSGLSIFTPGMARFPEHYGRVDEARKTIDLELAREARAAAAGVHVSSRGEQL